MSQTHDAEEHNSNQILHKIKSHLLTPDNKEYKVIITLPKIEYTIDSENFIFIKTLNKFELQDYIPVLF